MASFRSVTPRFAVSPQLSSDEVGAAADDGFGLIINNRPDVEAPDQPPGAAIEAAARARGLDYVHIPFAGRPNPSQIEAMRAAIAAEEGKTLAFCRTGTRSIMAWALGELAAGKMSRDEVLHAAAAAGYDLSPWLASPDQ